MNWKDEKFKFETRAIHAGQKPDPSTGAIMTPVYLSSTFVQSSPGVHKGYDYSRADNPTREAFENCLANLEGAKFGHAFGSGCGAMTTLLHLLKAGDHVVCSDDVYGGTFRLFDQVIRNNGIDFDFVNMTDVSNVEKALKPNTKLIWMETPTNPLMKLCDIRAICKVGKEKAIISVVDNTFMSPFFQKPLELGADISMHSTTKYIGGHSDLIGGATVTNNSELADKIKYLQKSMGAIPSPFDCFMGLRSLKTLAVRMKTHEQNAKVIADFLENHKKIDKVVYPGLKSHPQYDLACEQMTGFGGMITFFIKGGLDNAVKFLEKVEVFTLAESLGGVESLVEHPAIMTHASVPKEIREKIGLSDSLIRISVGIEDVTDLVADIEQALG
jgi:cystathionine gamma-lyase